MGLQGKGFFIWKIPDCAGGNPQKIAAAAQAAGLTHVMIKVADGNYAVNLNDKTKADLVPPVAAALKAAGIQVWGWHYVYGYDAFGESRVAIRRITELGLAGYVIDAEIEYSQPGRAAVASKFMREMRNALPDLPMALSSYRFPSLHLDLPWKAFLEHCDYTMPQVYWEQAHNPTAQLARTLKEFQALNPCRPVIPTGPAYKCNGWRPTDDDISTFLDAAAGAGVPAVNFFSWDECERDLKNLWDRIAQYPYGKPPAQPTKDLPSQWIEALNSRDLQAVTALYQPNAVQVTAQRTIQGQAALQSWYNDLLNRLLPGAVFALTGVTQSGPSAHFTWRATSPQASVQNGSDTLGIVGGKIAYHYTSFTITH